MSVITCKGLRKTYKAEGNSNCFSLAVDELGIEENKIYILLGPNGSGKTTLIKLIMGLLTPDSGNIQILGIDNQRPDSREKVGYLPENFSFPDNYKFIDAAYYFGLMKNISSKEVKDNIIKLAKALDLTQLFNKKISELSKGMQQSLALLHALLGENELLILDEPFNGLDPAQKNKAIEYLNGIKIKNNVTILITTHILGDIEKIGDQIIIIKQGKLQDSSSKEIIMSKFGSVENYYFSFFDKVQSEKEAL
ncbi:ABC transporter ATP-binding protein [Melioribacteraceae bacterium 4301-Me]|uniref:ABC transporter ATP-binding protein n=1 Tax=Pyranulibacter aquaticus TaxID=3163344 RepID=UPI0035964AAA